MCKREIALFDIDKTAYSTYTIFPLAKSQFEEGLLEADAVELLDQDMVDYKRGRINYEQFVEVLLDHWAAGLKGREYPRILENAVKFFEHNRDHFFPYVATVIELLRNTHDIFFVTGEPQFIAEAVCGRYCAAGYLSSVFKVNEQGLFTGKVATYLATKEQKRQALTKITQSHSLDNSYGFGDSDADIEMLSIVKTPICIDPNPMLLAHATRYSWTIVKPEQVMSYVK